jgi:hypothetical protein
MRLSTHPKWGMFKPLFRSRFLKSDWLLKSQPTAFHHFEVDGWSLTIFMAASGQEHHTIRATWGWGILTLIDALAGYHSLEDT